MARMRNKMRQKRPPKTEAAKRRRTVGGRQPKVEAKGQGHIDPLDRILMSKKQLGKRRSNPHANISLSNKKRKKLLKALAHQQRDLQRKKMKSIYEESEDYGTSILFGNDDNDQDENDSENAKKLAEAIADTAEIKIDDNDEEAAPMIE